MSDERVGSLMHELTQVRRKLNELQTSIKGDLSILRKVYDIVERSGELPSVHFSNEGQARYISVDDTKELEELLSIFELDGFTGKLAKRQELYEQSCRLRDMLAELNIDA